MNATTYPLAPAVSCIMPAVPQDRATADHQPACELARLARPAERR